MEAAEKGPASLALLAGRGARGSFASENSRGSEAPKAEEITEPWGRQVGL